MLPLLPTVLNRDYRTPYENPYEGLLDLVQRGTSKNGQVRLRG